MTLTEITNEVIALTKRPDLSAIISSAIRSATLKLHQMDFWDKDLVETIKIFSTASYLQTLVYSTDYPQWRAVKYLRKVDVNTGLVYGPFLKNITAETVLDIYGQTKQNVYYEAGTSLQINCSEAITKLALGYYANPVVSPDLSYASWIAINYPYAIIFDAAATVFKAIGFDSMEASMRLLVAEQKQILLSNNVQAVGY